MRPQSVSLAITSAGALTVTTAEAKTHMRVDTSDDDALIAAQVVAATKYITEFCNRSLTTTTYREKWDAFPVDDSPLVFRRPPLLTITSIAYVDTNGDSQTFSSDDYSADLDSIPGRAVLNYGESWPSTRTQPQAVTVTFTAGYGAAAAVPEEYKAAIKLLAAHLYENREPHITGTIVASFPNSLQSLLWMLRIPEVR